MLDLDRTSYMRPARQSTSELSARLKEFKQSWQSTATESVPEKPDASISSDTVDPEAT